MFFYTKEVRTDDGGEVIGLQDIGLGGSSITGS
jgi:hypothetical protein